MSTQDREEEQEIQTHEIIQKEKRRNSENKKSVGPSSQRGQKVDIWQRNEMEKHRKMMVENQKRAKENTIKEKNEQERAEQEQKDQLEKIRKEKKEQYEKYLRANNKQNEEKYLKQKQVPNSYNQVNLQTTTTEKQSKENIDRNREKPNRPTRQWMPKPVPLEYAEQHLEEQRIEQELFQNQMQQYQLEKHRMLGQNNIKTGHTTSEDDDSKFSIDGSKHLYIDSENESRQNQSKNTKKLKKDPETTKGLSQDEDYYGDHNISIVQNTYDINGGNSEAQFDMLGFDAYAKPKPQKKIVENKPKDTGQQQQQRQQWSKKQLDIVERNAKDQSDKMSKISKNTSHSKREMEGEDDWNWQDPKRKQTPENDSELPHGITNKHKEVSLSKEFQKINFQIEGEDVRGESRQSQIQPRKPDEEIKIHLDSKDIKYQLDQKEMQLLRVKQEQMVKEKKQQRIEQYLSPKSSQQRRDEINEREHDNSTYIQEFKQQFKDLKNQFNKDRKTSRTIGSTENIATLGQNIKQTRKQESDLLGKNPDLQLQKGGAKTLEVETKGEENNQPVADELQPSSSKQSAMSQSGKLLRPIPYLKDANKSMTKTPVEKPVYSKNQRERRKFWDREANENFLYQSIEEKATLTAISKFKHKLHQNISVDKQLNQQLAQVQEAPVQKSSEMQEWKKMNKQEVELQQEIMKMHFDSVDRIKEIEEKNNITLHHDESPKSIRNSQHGGSSRSYSAITSISQKSNKTGLTSKKGKMRGHNEINTISEIDNEDELEASLLNLENKLLNKKQKITRMTQEIEKQSQPKNPELQKEIRKNPQMMEQNPFSIDLTNGDKEYLEQEKSRFLFTNSNVLGGQDVSKLSKLNVSNMSQRKQNIAFRPSSNISQVSSANNISSTSKILPSHLTQQPLSDFAHKLPIITSKTNALKELEGNSKFKGTPNEIQHKLRESKGTNEILHKLYELKGADEISHTNSHKLKELKGADEIKQTNNQKLKELKGVDEIKQTNNQKLKELKGVDEIQHTNNHKLKGTSEEIQQTNNHKLKGTSEEIQQTNNLKMKGTSDEIKQTNNHKLKGTSDEIQQTNNHKLKEFRSSLDSIFKPSNLNQNYSSEQSKNIPFTQVSGLDMQKRSNPLQRRESGDRKEERDNLNLEGVRNVSETLPDLDNKVRQSKREDSLHQYRREDSVRSQKKKYYEQKQSVSPQLIESDKADLKTWWKQVKGSVEKNQNISSSFITIDKNFLASSESNDVQETQKNKKKVIKNEIERVEPGNNEQKQTSMKSYIEESAIHDEENAKQKEDVPRKPQKNDKEEKKQQNRIQIEDGIEIGQHELMSDNPSIVSISEKRIPSSTHEKKHWKSRNSSPVPTQTSAKKRKKIEDILNQQVISKLEFSQQQIEQTIQQTLDRLEKAEQAQVKYELEKRKEEEKSTQLIQSQNENRELSEISQNASFAESDFSIVSGNGSYSTRQMIKQQYLQTGRVPQRFHHDHLQQSRKSKNNSFEEQNISRTLPSQIPNQSKILAQIRNTQSNDDVIDEEEYQGDIKINKNINLQKILFVE